jgi:lysophospholipid acyltransferase (LPLAT)-like uncharacterized protein
MSGGGFKGLLLRLLLRCVSATWRYRESVPEDVRPLLEGSEPVIIAFWHGKMLPVWYRFRGQGLSALVSGSRDGELLAGYLERSLAYREVIRGSSSKGGRESLSQMVLMLGERSILVTPDGPRGPARHGKPGAMVAAMRSGRPLLMAGWSCRHGITLSSWDSMEIPYPFSVINIRYCIFDLQPTITSGREGAINRPGMDAIDFGEGNDSVPENDSIPLMRRIDDDDRTRFDALLDSLCEGSQ